MLVVNYGFRVLSSSFWGFSIFFHLNMKSQVVETKTVTKTIVAKTNIVPPIQG